MRPVLGSNAPGCDDAAGPGPAAATSSLGVPVRARSIPSACGRPTIAAIRRNGGAEIAYQGPVLAVEADSVRIGSLAAGAPIDIRRTRDRPCEWLLQSALVQARVRVGAPRSAIPLSGGRRRIRCRARCWAASRPIRAAASVDSPGAALRAGDVLPLRPGGGQSARRMLRRSTEPPARVRVVLGPQDDHFTQPACARCSTSTYTVSPASDRMGMRLEGPARA